MSGFAAILRFDGGPADPVSLAAMIEAIAYRGPDGTRQWSGEGAVGAHLQLHTTAESLDEAQPLLSEDGNLVLVMDGWLANPDEVRAELRSRGAPLRTTSDTELVLRAYEAWGDDCPRHLDGEYAFLVWDTHKREAFCAKDHAGLRPLHYHWDGKRLLVASDLAGVLAAGDFEARPNPGMIAEHLANAWFSQDETLWEGVTRLLPAHTMRVGMSGPHLRRYWSVSQASIRYADDRDYAAHYRELLNEAVKRASRTDRPLACEVSGGLDSSAVFAVAHRLQRDGLLQAPDLKGYTYYFGPDAPPELCEIEYARAVARHLGIELQEIDPFMPELEWFVARGRADRDMPAYPNTAMAVNTGKAATVDGCRVLLNGEGGDEFLSTYPYNYAEQLLQHDWRSLAQSLREDVAAFGTRRTAAMLYRYGIGPLAPARLRRLRRGRMRLSEADLRGWAVLTGSLQTLLEERRQRALDDGSVAGLGPHARRMAMAVSSGFANYVHDFMSRNSARLGYEQRSPLYARQLIEFVSAIPSRQLRWGARQKHVHLEALQGDLPEMVLRRLSKATFSQPFAVQLDRITYDVIAPSPSLGGLTDWIDWNGLARLRRDAEDMPVTERPVYELWAAFGCMALFGDVPASR